MNTLNAKVIIPYMSELELLSSLTKKEKAYLSRRECGLCEKQLSRPGCYTSIAEYCTDEQCITRIKSSLAKYKPRNVSLPGK